MLTSTIGRSQGETLCTTQTQRTRDIIVESFAHGSFDSLVKRFGIKQAFAFTSGCFDRFDQGEVDRQMELYFHRTRGYRLD